MLNVLFGAFVAVGFYVVMFLRESSSRERGSEIPAVTTTDVRPTTSRKRSKAFHVALFVLLVVVVVVVVGCVVLMAVLP